MSKNALFVRSTAHTPLTLTEPNPNPDKPGEAGPLRSVTLNSSGRPGVPAVTKLEGDDVATFEAWSKANENSDLMRSGVIEVGSDDDEDGEIEWGHEVFLEGAEGSGSTVDAEAGAVSSDDMTPKGPGKPNDGSGEPRHASQPGQTEPAKSSTGKAPAPDAASQKKADDAAKTEKK
jgi:hypothetical protein